MKAVPRQRKEHVLWFPGYKHPYALNSSGLIFVGCLGDVRSINAPTGSFLRLIVQLIFYDHRDPVGELIEALPRFNVSPSRLADCMRIRS